MSISRSPSGLAAALRSARLALALLLSLAAVAAYGTLPKEGGAAPGTFGSPLFLVLAALLTANVLYCTVHRFARSRHRGAARVTDLALHLSLALVIAGGASKAAFGVVLTAVVPVGTQARVAYDWGVRAERPLGFSLGVDGVDLGHYPFRALVGATAQATGRKLGLVEVGEGLEPARPDGVTVGFAGVDRHLRLVNLRVGTPASEGSVALGLAPGNGATREFGGYGFTLVAFKDEVRSVSARLRVVSRDGTASEARLSPNDSLAVDGTRVCLTAWGEDKFGNPYAGFQLTRDPGAPLFWAGCILLACAIPAHFVARARLRPPG